ncbi:UNVERIFIED_CONTAM: SdpI family protein [Streptococcus canis]|uniref:SdpI family protein n=1 Tax=Streptococcus canis TaxID=1329 RepID=A0AAE4Q6Z3_STRCB|nr:SdpI family protein [Streptococcus canis]MDV5976558.1 SdpI family protein [Streptococcus canis]
MLSKKLIVLSSLVTLSPIILGLILWQYLPEKIPTHFDLTGQADGFSTKLEGIMALPLIILGIHLITLFIGTKKPIITQKGPALYLIYWLLPSLCLVVQTGILLTSAGFVNRNLFNPIAGLACLFIALGFLLPYLKQNPIMGIRLPWTLADEDNWAKTHRFAGRVWLVCGGLLFLVSYMTTNSQNLVIGLLCSMVVLPVLYSYLLTKSYFK